MKEIHEEKRGRVEGKGGGGGRRGRETRREGKSATVKAGPGC